MVLPGESKVYVMFELNIFFFFHIHKTGTLSATLRASIKKTLYETVK